MCVYHLFFTQLTQLWSTGWLIPFDVMSIHELLKIRYVRLVRTGIRTGLVFFQPVITGPLEAHILELNIGQCKQHPCCLSHPIRVKIIQAVLGRHGEKVWKRFRKNIPRHQSRILSISVRTSRGVHHLHHFKTDRQTESITKCSPNFHLLAPFPIKGRSATLENSPSTL